MKLRLTKLALELGYSDDKLLSVASKKLRIPPRAILSCALVRRSIDARRSHGRPCFVASLDVEIDDQAAEAREAWQKMDSVVILDESDIPRALETPALEEPLPHATRPVVVGAGPAGLIAAWRLAKAGAQPILIERGAPVDERKASVGAFWAEGTLNPEDNVLYGEGGAGLYSDGKLTTRTKLRNHLRTVLELLVECGAPESVLIDADPHLGSDRLVVIVKQLRKQIIALGGEVRFHSKLDGIEIADGRLVAAIVNGQPVPTNHCLLATGHSARDVYEMLHQAAVPLAPKGFAVGVRIELPQSQIDHSQFGPDASHPQLGAASFRLTRRPKGDIRACYSFCMCPGGSVIACASSPGVMTTNGMSLSSRSGKYGNAAFLVPVSPEDFGGTDDNPLAGIAWQADIEAKAFAAGGGDYSLPACRLRDFLGGHVSRSLPKDRSCQRSVPADLQSLFPTYISQTLTKVIRPMLQPLSQIRAGDGIVYGAETRSSSPVRVVRDDSFQSTGVVGLYPAGEGAGYAGGIITSAIDGLRATDGLLANMI
jgi:uncharacterized protein